LDFASAIKLHYHGNDIPAIQFRDGG